jgi:hypothetical protein
MVWPIMRGKSYVDETGKSMKAVELPVSQKVVGETSQFHQQFRSEWKKRELERAATGASPGGTTENSPALQRREQWEE